MKTLKAVYRVTMITGFTALLFLPATAYAACELPGTAAQWVNWLAQQIPPQLNMFIKQEQNFTDRVAATASTEKYIRLDEFDTNIRSGMSDWWTNYYLPALRQSTAQISAAKIDQTRTIGSFIDAQIMNETALLVENKAVDSARRYRIDENVCQLDSSASAHAEKGQVAQALSRIYTLEESRRINNAKNTASAQGKKTDQKERWEKFVTLFCDPSRGDIGCIAPGVLAGKHTNLPNLLWGDKQTLDLSAPENQTLTQEALRYLIGSNVPNPIPDGALSSSQGQEALLARRANTARINAVYSALGQMLTERAGGNSGGNPYIKDIQEASGLPIGIASSDPSYREIMKAMAKNRVRDPAYVLRLINNPESLLREQSTTGAIRLQQMNTLYKRLEEMLLMEAAGFAAELDAQKLNTASGSTPIN